MNAFTIYKENARTERFKDWWLVHGENLGPIAQTAASVSVAQEEDETLEPV